MKKFYFIAIAFLLLNAISTTAQWSSDPEVNTLICDAIDEQTQVKVISASDGGYIFVWRDYRNSSEFSDIFAQKVDSLGVVQWTENGVAICTAEGGQSQPQLISDGSGGAIITWCDGREGVPILEDIYAQRINSNGVVQWTDDGVLICGANNNQEAPQITSDGELGAIIAWWDNHSGNWDIYAQRIDFSGSVLWTEDGVRICNEFGEQYIWQLISDGAGGAILSWEDYRNPSTTGYDIYAQKINSDGECLWTNNGVAICTENGSQAQSYLASDGLGGAVIIWLDQRDMGITGIDVYAQKINSSGSVQWTVNGVAICTEQYNQMEPKIISDGSGGAIIAWHDRRNNTDNDIYAQKIYSVGTVAWTTDGVAICTATYNQMYPQLTSDGSGGAIITWADYNRLGSKWDIYAQKISSVGNVAWAENGIIICGAVEDQYYPQITSNGSGGAVVVWYDYRSISYSDIYAQNINSDGALGEEEEGPPEEITPVPTLSTWALIALLAGAAGFGGWFVWKRQIA